MRQAVLNWRIRAVMHCVLFEVFVITNATGMADMDKLKDAANKQKGDYTSKTTRIKAKKHVKSLKVLFDHLYYIGVRWLLPALHAPNPEVVATVFAKST